LNEAVRSSREALVGVKPGKRKIKGKRLTAAEGARTQRIADS
jgi:hypothetical protein